MVRDYPLREDYFRNLRAELFSVFIDNIPEGKGVDWLRALFNKDGKPMDVFIPARVRKATNSRFGFVRYKSLEVAEAATRRWNGAIVGKAKLLVSLVDKGGKPNAACRVERSWPEVHVGDHRIGGGSPDGLFKRGGASMGIQANREGEVANNSKNFKRRRVKMEAFQEYED
ncbi:hypothetical protein QQ045_020678 [Rhodiola kirilowii]